MSFNLSCYLHNLTRSYRNNPGAPDNDNPYFVYSKQIQRSLVGFGSIGTVFFTRGLISEAVLGAANENPSIKEMQETLKHVKKHKCVSLFCIETLLTHKFRLKKTQEYKMLVAGVSQIIRDFPELRDDLKQAQANAEELVNKLREVCLFFDVIICAYMHLTNISLLLVQPRNAGCPPSRQFNNQKRHLSACFQGHKQTGLECLTRRR